MPAAIWNGWTLYVTGGGGGGSGTVTSVALALPSSVFTVSGSPVNVMGTLTGAFNNQNANTVFAGPATGAAAAPAFRALVAADIPSLPYGTGTVTSVGMTGDNVIFNTVVGGSPFTGSGTLVPALLVQTPNVILAGPASGATSLAPTFRAIVAGDLPTSGIANVLYNNISGQAISYTNSGGVGSSVNGLSITPTYSQTSTAGATDLLVNRTGTVGSGTQRLLDLQVAGVSQFSVSSNGSVTTQGLLLVGAGVGTVETAGVIGGTTNVNLLLQSRNFTAAGDMIDACMGTFSNSSGQANTFVIKPTYNQTSTAAATDLVINRTETTVGSGAQKFLAAQVGGTEKIAIDHAGVINQTNPLTTVNGSTAGAIQGSQPFQGSTHKKAVIFVTNLNGTATYTYPTAFTSIPAFFGTTGIASLVSSNTTSSITFTGVGAVVSGYVIIEGS